MRTKPSDYKYELKIQESKGSWVCFPTRTRKEARDRLTKHGLKGQKYKIEKRNPYWHEGPTLMEGVIE